MKKIKELDGRELFVLNAFCWTLFILSLIILSTINGTDRTEMEWIKLYIPIAILNWIPIVIKLLF